MAISTILSHHGMLWSVGKNEEETGKKKEKKGGRRGLFRVPEGRPYSFNRPKLLK